MPVERGKYGCNSNHIRSFRHGISASPLEVVLATVMKYSNVSHDCLYDVMNRINENKRSVSSLQLNELSFRTNISGPQTL